MNRIYFLVGTALGVTLAFWASAASAQTGATGKKVIEYGWDVPSPDFIAEHIREMEQRPFDGLIFKLLGGNSVLDPKPWDEHRYDRDFEILPTIEWQRFTDNFIIMFAASNQDWFDDAQWDAIVGHARLIARAGRVAKCTGLCFDAEPYGDNPWAYTSAAHRDTKSFTEYEDMARRRGAQFIQAIEAELPKPKILTFFLDSLFFDMCLPMPDELRKERLATRRYALLPAFLEGMLEGSGPDVEFIDGNENSYYYNDSRQYFDEYHGVTQRVRYLVDPKYWPAYRAKVRAGQALYIDQYFGLRDLKVLGNYMTPEERPKWFEHNAYWALYTTDTYVWCYSEHMNWWTNTTIPDGAEAALRAARARIDAGRMLLCDLGPIVAAAKERESQDVAGGIIRRQTDVIFLSPQTKRPSIDGILDDTAWQKAAPLEAFLTPVNRPAQLHAQTEARLLYDDQNIYVALTCQEPDIGHLRADTTAEDAQSIFDDDVVEVFISRIEKQERFYHFAVNPKGVAWAAIHDGDAREALAAPWQHGARIGPDNWTVEIAIPWKSLGITAPSPGLKLRANLGRERAQGAEISTWRSVVQTFLEPQNFGAWLFR